MPVLRCALLTLALLGPGLPRRALDHAVDNVSFDDLVDRFLPELNRRVPGHGFRLPAQRHIEAGHGQAPFCSRHSRRSDTQPLRQANRTGRCPMRTRSSFSGSADLKNTPPIPNTFAINVSSL